MRVETRPCVSVVSIDAQGATLVTGALIPAATVIWCAGMQADPLTARFPVARDRLGRLPIDANLKIKGMPVEFAAGDVAWLPIDGTHASVMSCQHARPMGRFAGYNVVGDLLSQPMLNIDWYVTCLDLGPWGPSIRKAGTARWRRRARRPSASRRSSIASASIRHSHATGARFSMPRRRSCRPRRTSSIDA
jgi:NADH dehydrogenase FAD-containing subunit